MKKLLLIGFAFCFLFFSCKHDDDDWYSSSSLKDADVVGVWKCEGTDVYGNDGGETYLNFMRDGTYIVIDAYSHHICFGTWKCSRKKLGTALPEGFGSSIGYEVTSDYKVENGKLYITSEKKGAELTVVAQQVADDVISPYITIQTLDDFLKDKPTVNIDDYKINLNDHKIKKISALCPDNNHPHAIDLGEAGKWSCCNVGASSPVEPGGYYAWGETEEKDSYTWSTYSHCDGDFTTCHNIGDDIAGTKYDVAHVKWGDSWKMPSLDRAETLINKCNPQYVTLYEKNKDYYYTISGRDIYAIDGDFYEFDRGYNIYTKDGGYYQMDIINSTKHFLYNGICYDLSGIDVNSIYLIKDYVYTCNRFHITFYGYDEETPPRLSLGVGMEKLSASSLPSSSFKFISNGAVFTGADGHSIFLPALTGCSNDESIFMNGYSIGYWSSSTGSEDTAYDFFFHNNELFWGFDDRYWGLAIRPVRD